MKYRYLGYSDLRSLGVAGDRPLSETLGEIPPERRAQVAAYLREGRMVVGSLARLYDIYTGERISSASGSILTDGEWIWLDQIAHYVERHGAGLPAEFLQKVQRIGRIDTASIDIQDVRAKFPAPWRSESGAG